MTSIGRCRWRRRELRVGTNTTQRKVVGKALGKALYKVIPYACGRLFTVPAITPLLVILRNPLLRGTGTLGGGQL